VFVKAIVQTAYGSPNGFELRELPEPTIKKPTDVLIRVHATSIHAGDLFMMRGMPYFTRFVVGFPRPRGYIPGYDAAGRVEAVGKEVSRFREGDEVFGSFAHTCAELVVAPDSSIEPIPSNLTLQQAAAVPTSAVAALHGLRDAAKVQSGQHVLINGASGGVGTFAVQIAKAYGAEVTAVCSIGKMDLVREIGADHVIDYAVEDFTNGGPRYDVVLDQVANRPLRACWRALKPRGIHVPNSGHSGMPYILKALLVSLFVRKQAGMYVATPKPGDLVELRGLIEAGKLTPVIDRAYPLEQFPIAMAYLNNGHARGKVVIRME
jgi:NADPH:quinone reductase-like Zn-dependent oxidoreductase